MNENGPTPRVACTLTEDGKQQRPEWVRSVLVSSYDGVEEGDDGYTLLFCGTDESLSAVATFVANELQCCSFVDYEIGVSPPYERTRLTVTGPEGAKAILGDGLVDRLEAGTW